MKAKIVKAKDIGVDVHNVRHSGILDALANMKPGDAIMVPHYVVSSMTPLANRVCLDRTWHQRKAADGKMYIVCKAKK